MKTIRIRLWGMAMLALALSVGCAPKRKEVTERDRKEAAHLGSEAQFAMTLRDWARAEKLLAKAAELSPEPEYYMGLGAARVRLGQKAGAKQAYEGALKLFQDEAARDNTRADPWLHQVNVLALLGRHDDAQAILAKAVKQFPNDPRTKTMGNPKAYQLQISSPGFKENAL